MSVRRLAFPLTGSLLLSLVTGCAALGLGGSGGSGSAGATDGEGSLPDGRVSVAAAFYPLAWVAERVGGERVEVAQLTSPGAEPHDLELTVGETAEVARADLVLVEGGFQAAVDAAVDGEVAGTVLDARDVVGLEPFEGDHPGEDGQAEDHQDGQGGDGLDGLDPHFWLDPLRMADLADEVAEQLGAIDAPHAEDYAGRADALRAELRQLDADYAEGLADCRRDVVLVNHDAFGYLARYGLDFEPIAGLSPGAEPSPADLDRLQRTAREAGVTTVFSERLVSASTAESLAGDLGLEADVLDPVEGLTDQTADEDYLSLMRANLATLARAQGC